MALDHFTVSSGSSVWPWVEGNWFVVQSCGCAARRWRRYLGGFHPLTGGHSTCTIRVDHRASFLQVVVQRLGEVVRVCQVAVAHHKYRHASKQGSDHGDSNRLLLNFKSSLIAAQTAEPVCSRWTDAKTIAQSVLPRNSTCQTFYACVSSVIAGSTRKTRFIGSKSRTRETKVLVPPSWIADQPRLTRVSTERFSAAVPRWMQAHQTLVLNCFAQASSTKVVRLARRPLGKAVEAVAEPFPMQPAPRLAPTTSADCLN